MLTGPVAGIRVLEFAGLGAAPFACSLLADAGADVVRVERPGVSADPAAYSIRGRTVITLDLKKDEDIEHATSLAQQADVLVEGFRPGVMERLGLGPEPLMANNPGLVYGRMTGWGREGPRAPEPGHDLNYLALIGAARAIAREGEDPVPPLNLIADYGGGLLLAYGLLLALHERSSSGRGQVVDTAMVDAGLTLMSGLWQRRADGRWNDVPGTNDMDSGAPFYNSYRTKDGHYMAVACIENRFYQNFVAVLGDPDLLDAQWDRSRWRARKQRVSARFLERTREEWTQAFGKTEACVTPVNSISEVVHDPHIAARGSVIERDGAVFPAPAPRLSRTPLETSPDPRVETDLTQVLAGWARHT